MTSSVFGISGRSSAPVESSTRGLSIDERGNPRRLGSGRQDDVVDVDRLARRRAVRTCSSRRADDRRPALQVVDLAQLGDLPGAARQLLDDLVLVAAQLVDVDRRLAELDAPVAGMRGLVQHLRHVQQRLRRNAAAIETDAAGVLLGIDQRDLHPEVGGIERRGIPSGTGTDDSNDVACRHVTAQTFSRATSP